MRNNFFAIIFLAGCATTQQPPPVAQPEPPKIPKRMLIVGDSHSDYLGNRRGTFGFFGQRLKELTGADLIAVSGSSPGWFLRSAPAKWGCTISMGQEVGTCTATPAVPATDILVVELGANMNGRSSDSIHAEAKAFLSAASFEKCFWVGPPNARLYSKAMLDATEAGLTGLGCTVISSRAIPFEEGHLGDGEHMSQAAYEAWAQLVARKVAP